MMMMICLLTVIGLTPGGSSTVHIYAPTIHRTTQRTEQHNAQNNTINVTTQYTEHHNTQSNTIHKNNTQNNTMHRTTQ